MRNAKRIRHVRRALLIVGEGKAEEVFLKHICRMYARGDNNLQVKIKNANGKGALHVVNYTIRQMEYANFDLAASLFDADVDWNASTQALANERGVITLPSDPCLEATLLKICNREKHADSARQKREFERIFKGNAHDSRIITNHFGKNVLEEARNRMEILDQLVKLIE